MITNRREQPDAATEATPTPDGNDQPAANQQLREPRRSNADHRLTPCEAEPDAWFGNTDDREQAVQACQSCPLLDPCQAYALAHPEWATHGVWAGVDHEPAAPPNKKPSQGKPQTHTATATAHNTTHVATAGPEASDHAAPAKTVPQIEETNVDTNTGKGESPLRPGAKRTRRPTFNVPHICANEVDPSRGA